MPLSIVQMYVPPSRSFHWSKLKVNMYFGLWILVCEIKIEYCQTVTTSCEWKSAVKLYTSILCYQMLLLQCLVLLVPCISSPCRWTSQCKKRRNTWMCRVGSTTFSIIQVCDNICLMSSLSRTDYILMLIKENLNVMLEGCFGV